MSEKSLSVGVTVEPLIGSLIGCAIGYSCAPRKYSLKNLITLDKDTFERIYTNDVVKGFTADEKAAYTGIKEARDAYDAVKISTRDGVRERTNIWKRLYSSVEVPESVKTEYQQKKAILDDLMRENNYTEAITEYRRLQGEVRKSPTDKLLREQFNAADLKLSGITVKLYEAINSYRSAVNNFAFAKKKQLKENPAKYSDIFEAAKNVQSACAERQTIMTNKLFEICSKQTVKNNYEILKTTVPKFRAKSSAIWALVCGGLTAIAAKIMYKVIGKTA